MLNLNSKKVEIEQQNLHFANVGSATVKVKIISAKGLKSLLNREFAPTCFIIMLYNHVFVINAGIKFTRLLLFQSQRPIAIHLRSGRIRIMHFKLID